MLREAWKLLRGVVDGKYCPEVWLLASGLSAQAMTKMQSGHLHELRPHRDTTRTDRRPKVGRKQLR